MKNFVLSYTRLGAGAGAGAKSQVSFCFFSLQGLSFACIITEDCVAVSCGCRASHSVIVVDILPMQWRVFLGP